MDFTEYNKSVMKILIRNRKKINLGARYLLEDKKGTIKSVLGMLSKERAIGFMETELDKNSKQILQPITIPINNILDAEELTEELIEETFEAISKEDLGHLLDLGIKQHFALSLSQILEMKEDISQLKEDDLLPDIDYVMVMLATETRAAQLYQEFLLKEGKELVKGLDDTSQPPLVNERIEWKGNQKELAELFLELWKKGWLEEVPIGLIQSYFTNFKTIDQYLKEARAENRNMGTFDKVYSQKYRKRFDGIKPNTKGTRK